MLSRILTRCRAAETVGAIAAIATDMGRGLYQHRRRVRVVFSDQMPN